MAKHFLALCVMLFLMVTTPDASENVISNIPDVLSILQTYGMNMLHAGKDYFQLKSSIKWKIVELEDVQIFNLKSMYMGCKPEVKILPTTTGFNDTRQIRIPCFNIAWCVGFDELPVIAQSKFNVVFKTKFHYVEMKIKPMLLETQLKICFPITEPTSNSRLNSTCDAAFTAEVENVRFKKFGGFRIKGKGTLNKLAGFFVNNGISTRLIQGEILRKMRKMLPQKLTEFRERMCYKIDRYVKKTIDVMLSDLIN